MELIDKAAVVAEIDKQGTIRPELSWFTDILIQEILSLEVKEVDLEQPEPYFYCKYGGIIPLCSDCKRNHRNSSFKTEEIIT